MFSGEGQPPAKDNGVNNRTKIIEISFFITFSSNLIMTRILCIIILEKIHLIFSKSPKFSVKLPITIAAEKNLSNEKY
jgi:hypothetical protein